MKLTVAYDMYIIHALLCSPSKDMEIGGCDAHATIPEKARMESRDVIDTPPVTCAVSDGPAVAAAIPETPPENTAISSTAPFSDAETSMIIPETPPITSPASSCSSGIRWMYFFKNEALCFS